VPIAVSGAAYRTLQETLANALKHASASRVTVDLLFDARRVRMVVDDDGVGFDSTTDSPGLGLTGMRERAEELGGVTEIVSTPGGGTRVTLDLPTGGQEPAAPTSTRSPKDSRGQEKPDR
jgi:signal transduction histidine kinase